MISSQFLLLPAASKLIEIWYSTVIRNTIKYKKKQEMVKKIQHTLKIEKVRRQIIKSQQAK